MVQHPSARVQETGEIVAEYMDAILKLFKPGAKILVMVRRPDKPDGSQDFILTNDTLDGAIAALQARKAGPTISGQV